jgi:hypothetical protein
MEARVWLQTFLEFVVGLLEFFYNFSCVNILNYSSYICIEAIHQGAFRTFGVEGLATYSP